MRNLIYISGTIFCLAGIAWNNAQAQVFTAKEGSFVLFHETPDKLARVKLTTPDDDRNTYQWPSSENEFIAAYRTAEKIIEGPVHLTDDDLQKMWKMLEEMPVLAPSYQFHPTMLLAMGQATLIPGHEMLSTCVISIRHDKNQEISKTLQWRDHIASTTSAKAELVKDNGSSIHLKFLFPKESWIKGAQVLKKVVGGIQDDEIFPFIYTSALSDRIEMNIRDTMNTIGEFLYTIHPIDQLGNTHTALQPIYAHNYNSISAPAILSFKSESLNDSKTIQLTWDCTIRERVRGFEIYRSLESDGPYMKIASLPSSDSGYIDHVQGVMRNFFYYVQILDQMGKGSKSIIHFVTPMMKEKPEPPIDLLATPAKRGVRLTWPTMDGLYQTRGYYVYRRDKDTSSWTQVSEFIPRSGEIMSYTDTSTVLQTQNEYTYVVRSESTSYQLSDPSVTASARPDKQREVATPQDVSWRHMDDSRLMLYWSDQRKYDPYILRYHVYTANAEGLPDTEVSGSPMDVNQNFWIQPDGTTAAFGYCVQAEDAWGNMSSPSVDIKPLSNSHSPEPGIILIKLSQKGYRLSWGLPEDSRVKSIELYEQNPSGNPVLVKSLSPTTAFYEIPIWKDDLAKSYFLTYKWADGKESESGDVVTITK